GRCEARERSRLGVDSRPGFILPLETLGELCVEQFEHLTMLLDVPGRDEVLGLSWCGQHQWLPHAIHRRTLRIAAPQRPLTESRTDTQRGYRMRTTRYLPLSATYAASRVRSAV